MASKTAHGLRVFVALIEHLTDCLIGLGVAALENGSHGPRRLPLDTLPVLSR